MNDNGKSDSQHLHEKKTRPRVKFDLGPEEVVSHGKTERSQETERHKDIGECEETEIGKETDKCINAEACQEDGQGTETKQPSGASQKIEQAETSQQSETSQQGETGELCMECRQSYGSGQNNHDFVLRMAIYSDHPECVRALIRAGADVNRKINARLVHDVVINGHDDCLKVLIEAGADVNRNDNDGNTPVMVAARDGRDECLQTLIAAGASVNTINIHGITALHLAALCGQFHARTR